jgi:pyruvate/2-oxoglutarate dehydrogenase complex dihydrolipoamide acyltransferase (E2) component
MPKPVHTPRVNNNDDEVKLSHLYVDRGTKVRSGDPVAEVETEKATFTVEAEHEGYVLAVNGGLGEMLAVGSVLVWLGETPDEKVESAPAPRAAANGTERKEPTLKALLLLKHYGLDAAEVPAGGAQLTAEDVRRFAAGRAPATAKAARPAEASPLNACPTREEPLTPEQRGMMRTVSWQREHAVPGYIEIEYDPAPWAQYAAEFKAAHGLWFDPMLSLLGWRLAQLAAEYPRINATVGGTAARLYEGVNLGFTVQADSTLYLVVVKSAGRMDAQSFVRELATLQLGAMRHALTPEQTSDATLSFSSMARWNVTRHMPVLPPETSLIVAHTATTNGAAHLGATYDHRLLTGYDVVRALQALARPPAQQ